jgi:hypothetical protein
MEQNHTGTRWDAVTIQEWMWLAVAVLNIREGTAHQEWVWLGVSGVKAEVSTWEGKIMRGFPLGWGTQ